MLFSLKATDLMSENLVIVPQDMSLSGAAHLLSQGNVSGSPVVNDQGQCIGVLSATDFLHATENKYQDVRIEDVVSSSQIIIEEKKHPVRDFMNNQPVMVDPTAGIADIAAVMLAHHIHRVVVAHKDGKPLGIISSMDIVAAVSRYNV